MPSFRIHRLVEFSDTDMAGIVHFANFFRFMEAAEHAYLRACGLSVFADFEGQTITFPRVSATCDYQRPARFQDVLAIDVQVEHLGRTSVKYAFTFNLADDVIARGQVTAVLCRVVVGAGEGEHQRRLEPFPIPEPVRQKLLQGPKEPLKEVP